MMAYRAAADGQRALRCTIAAVVAILVVSLAACGGGSSGGGGNTTPPSGGQPPLPGNYIPTGRAVAGDAFVHLFEWRWADIATECEQHLGPKGFKAVQISPPSEHAVIIGTSSGLSYPWWQRYQTVSYSLAASRSGTQAEFVDMVNRCKARGVDIYADAVINHMTAGSGTGSAGSAYSKYSYPAVPFGSGDFHAGCGINSYQNAFEVQNCELVGLADLKTEDDSVRTRIANYLIALNSLGVAGFRIDAAKHMHPRDIDGIIAKVNAAAMAAGRPMPYVFLEVINNAGEAVTAQQYFGVGNASNGASDVTEFQYSYRLSDAFLGRNGLNLSLLQALPTNFLPGDKAVVFTDNHDNQRGGNIYFADGVYELANVFLLAYPYGYPALMSSYGFDRNSAAGRDQGPPANANGLTQSTFHANGASRCTTQIGSAQAGSWVCEHRRRAISGMVGFRKAAAGAAVAAWQNFGTNQIGFARETKGYVVINRGGSAVAATVQTTLPTGNYCNVIADEFMSSLTTSCTGLPIAVAADGTANINVPAGGALAIHVGAKLN
jgi:alpha-amylase